MFFSISHCKLGSSLARDPGVGGAVSERKIHTTVLFCAKDAHFCQRIEHQNEGCVCQEFEFITVSMGPCFQQTEVCKKHGDVRFLDHLALLLAFLCDIFQVSRPYPHGRISASTPGVTPIGPIFSNSLSSLTRGVLSWDARPAGPRRGCTCRNLHRLNVKQNKLRLQAPSL